MGIEAKKQPLNVAIVTFPGSNCDRDTLKFFRNGGHNAEFVWYKDRAEPRAGLLVLPGGFAFGDRVYSQATGSYRLDPGIQALNTPVMDTIRKWGEQGRPILGICNGFQILVHAGMLPGTLKRNESDRFFCDDVDCLIEGRSFFNAEHMLGNSYHVNIAHGFGRYFTLNAETYQHLVAKGQIFMRYLGINPNGSDGNIAGVCNEEGNIWGMMPHPERTDPATQRVFLGAIRDYVK